MITLALLAAPAALAGTCGGLPASGAVAPGSYTFAPLCVHTLTGRLLVTGPVTIDGGGGRIEGDHTFRLIDVVSGDFTLQNVTLYAGGGDTAAGMYAGTEGEGHLVIDRVAFYDNDSAVSGGALLFYALSVNVTNSWFEGNDAGDWGGAVRATYVQDAATFQNNVFKNNTSGANRGQYSSGGYNVGTADINDNYWNMGDAPVQPADVYLAGNAIPTAPLTRWLTVEPPNVMHPYLDVVSDVDGDGIPDALDKCRGVNTTGDSDKDGVCNDLDLCLGDDASGDADNDGLCGDRDKCLGVDLTGDADKDGVCTDLDLCVGDDATGDSDLDLVCDDRDLCAGDDATRDLDGDGFCGDVDKCAGDDLVGDVDTDGTCDDRDLCTGDDATGDVDADGECGDIDPCLGDDSKGDADADGFCDDRDQCLGDDSSGNWDADALCDDTDPPVAIVSDGPYAAEADVELLIAAAEGVLANDTIVGGTIAVSAVPQHGTVTLAEDGGFSYKCDDPEYFGPDWFEYEWADDDDLLSATVTLSVGVEVPVSIGAEDDLYTVRSGETLTVDVATGVLANDFGENLVATVETEPANGVLALTPQGSFSYEPSGQTAGVDRFTYSVSNGTETVIGRVTIVIDDPVEDTSVVDPYDGARCRCAPGSGVGGVGASAFAFVSVMFGRRRVRREA